MRLIAAAVIASITFSFSVASAESKAQPPVYEMKLVYVADASVEFLFVIGNSGFQSIESLKNFLASLPAGTKLTWDPGCIRMGREPLLSSEYEMEDFKAFCLEHRIDFVLVPSG